MRDTLNAVDGSGDNGGSDINNQINEQIMYIFVSSTNHALKAYLDFGFDSTLYSTQP